MILFVILISDNKRRVSQEPCTPRPLIRVQEVHIFPTTIIDSQERNLKQLPALNLKTPVNSSKLVIGYYNYKYNYSMCHMSCRRKKLFEKMSEINILLKQNAFSDKIRIQQKMKAKYQLIINPCELYGQKEKTLNQIKKQIISQ